jgi:predicted O-methyltransferase YrrM
MADDALWKDVERYLIDQVLDDDPALDAALADSRDQGLPWIQVSPLEGRFLHLIARLVGARRILEVGTLGGYSAICMARALPPNGRLVSLEVDPKYAAVARSNVERAGLTGLVDVRVGAAADSLAGIERAGEGPFDLTFIDADKRSTPAYFDAALRLSRPGSVIIVDNVVRDGKLVDASLDDPDNAGMRRFLERIAQEPRVTATVLQTVGGKGWDGFAFVRVNG